MFGITISPYLFFWQASQEAEELKATKGATPLKMCQSRRANTCGASRSTHVLGWGSLTCLPFYHN